MIFKGWVIKLIKKLVKVRLNNKVFEGECKVGVFYIVNSIILFLRVVVIDNNLFRI